MNIKNLINLCLAFLIKWSPKILAHHIWTILDNSESRIAILYRRAFLKKYAKCAGENLYVGKNTSFKNIGGLSLGNNVSIHAFTYIDSKGGVTIKDNVSIANHCTIIASDHTWMDKNIPIKFNEVHLKPIFIDEDVWIAAGCRILGNVRIESRTVVGAGAVVNKSLQGNSLYVGVPAKLVKNI